MNKYRYREVPKAAKQCLLFALFVLCIFPSSYIYALNLNVVDGNGAPVTGFRWLLEEDTTNYTIPGVPVSDSLAVSIHSSYTPVVDKGHSTGSSATITVPDNNKRYFVSVLPDSGYTMSGANVGIGQDSVTVTVNGFPVPTAQISVFVFNDNDPISGEPNIIDQSGLSNFSILVFDGAGQVFQDAFGNPLGTTYNQDGSVASIGSGIILTDSNGKALIKNLPPGKYGIQAVPPAGTSWVQTSTIEGTPTIDAWVKAGEPPFLIEFAPAFYHVFIGFVDPTDLPWALSPPGGTGTITGRLVNNHFSSPPLVESFPGHPVPECWVGLNSSSFEGLYAQPCNPDSTFTITGIPPGTYQLVMWDFPLDYLFGFFTVQVGDGETVNLGDVPVFGWFGTLEGSVFFDADEDGFRDSGEIGIPGQAVNLRFRNGSIYKATTTDLSGQYSIKEVFPFFHYLVAEVDFVSFKATGATIAVDDGGAIPPANGWIMPSRDRLNPQPQASVNPNTGNNLSRTETGVVLTEAMLLFAGQTNVIDWGKTNYSQGENGGITGIVFYATTRAEDDPRYAVGEAWEFGIPRVQVNLYQDSDEDGVMDDLDGDGVATLADTDNYPFGWFNGGAMGPEDVDINGNGVFDPGDAIQIVTSDSWDDNMPQGCLGDPLFVHGQQVDECYENWRQWNEIRPGVFDGGYAFDSYYPGGMASGSNLMQGLPSGTYIVEAVAPPGYEIVKEEDKNVDFGEEYVPEPVLLPPLCVGNLHEVPPELSLFPGISAPFAGEMRPLCDRKQINVTDGKNAAVDFFLFTEVPKTARVVGLITNDLGPDFFVDSPLGGEKAPVPWMPVSFRDYKGNEIVRVYSDEWGSYNALLPSTYTVNIPAPTGVSPHMVDVCLNDPGPIPDPNNPGQFITDPQFDPRFSRICYTFNFTPGNTTYVDTPVIPLSGFAAATAVLDCEFPDKTPVISYVSGPGQGGPYAAGPGDTIIIVSVGSVEVPNPDYPGSGGPTIVRDYSFGSVPGSITVGGVPLENLVWSSDGLVISGTVPAGMQTGQLIVRRGDNGKSTEMGITLTIGSVPDVIHVSPGESIQAAIDNPLTPSGALILVAPGTYKESVIMWKNVRLQGWGAHSTTIEAISLFDKDKLSEWKEKINTLVENAEVDLLPEQDPGNLFRNESAPGITVAVKDGDFTANPRARIDGFTITGSTLGSGIFVNAFAHYMEISNNKITSNQGTFGGGIRIGTPMLSSCTGAGDGVNFGCNDHINIHHNHITQNGGINGGGGVSLYNGTDSYELNNNNICGNFTRTAGAGMYHYGLSFDGRIESNKFLFNEVFYGSVIGGDGGGIYIGGEPPPVGMVLSPGSGSVSVVANLIQGNQAGSGDGGGIRLLNINGQDVEDSLDPPNDFYNIKIFNNIIVDNLSAFLGGGIALKDAAMVYIVNNTIAYNDSAAINLEAFGSLGGLPAAGFSTTIPQGAGIVARVHSNGLQTALTVAGFPKEFSEPAALEDNIIWQNRSFYWDASENGGLGGLQPKNPANPYWDLQVFGTTTPQRMDPKDCILTSLIDPDTGDSYDTSNVVADPIFVSGYFNELQTAAVADEGGNFVFVTLKPLTVTAGDYHIMPGSPAIDKGSDLTGTFPELQTDYDGEVRPNILGVDIGADELYIFFNDVPDGFAWAEDYIYAIASRGITLGCGNNNFCPGSLITRAEMAAFIVRALYGENFSFGIVPHFPDVPGTHWAFRYIQRLYESNITTGYGDGTYRPDNPASRAEIAAFVIRALYGESFSYGTTPHFPDVPETHWAFKYIQRLYEDSITTGYPDGSYRPANTTSRAESAAFVSRAFLGMP